MVFVKSLADREFKKSVSLMTLLAVSLVFFFFVRNVKVYVAQKLPQSLSVLPCDL